MSRIVAPAELDGTAGKTAAVALHDHTYGITSDPLTRFACAFSALIHDVDHLGVSNAQLVKEESPLAARFNDRSVAGMFCHWLQSLLSPCKLKYRFKANRFGIPF